MNRSDRILLEDHVRQLDQMSRTILDMRSVLTRRIRRLETVPAEPIRSTVTQRRRRDNVPPIEPIIVVPPVDLPTTPTPPRQRSELLNWVLARRTQNATIPVIRIKKYNITVKTVALKKSEEHNRLPELCGICLDTHFKVDSVTCDCKHQFGAACFNGWKQTCIQNGKIVNCPSCRVNIQKIVAFRLRAKKAELPQNIEADPENEDIIIVVE